MSGSKIRHKMTMELLRQEIRTLAEKLKRSGPPPGSVEETTLIILLSIEAKAQMVTCAKDLDECFAELNQFWLNSIDWCSQLSKEIEKLLIIQEELSIGDPGQSSVS